MNKDVCIREMEERDLEAADEVLKQAFGGLSRLEDLRLYRQIQPDGWFVAEKEDHLAGMVGAVSYQAFAHVGLMAVNPPDQRQGIGLALMQSLLGRLERQGVPLVTLDASRMGRPLYDRLGFVPYDDTHVYLIPGWRSQVLRPVSVQVLSPADVDELVELDQEVFGADRRKVFQALLERFPGRAFMQRDRQGRPEGYLFAQANRIGPWVMLKTGRAEELLNAALGLKYEGSVSVTVPSTNREALELLEAYGFERGRSNRHMGKGDGGCPGRRDKVYSQMSLAVG